MTEGSEPPVEDIYLQLAAERIPLHQTSRDLYTYWGAVVPVGELFRPVVTNHTGDMVTAEMNFVGTGKEHRANLMPGETSEGKLHDVHRFIHEGEYVVIHVALWEDFWVFRKLVAHHTISLSAKGA